MPVQHSLSWLKLAKSVTNVKKLDRVWAIWVKKLSALPEAKLWAHMVGPASSMIALLLNWGWIPTGPTDWTSNDGVRYNLDHRTIVTSRSCASFVHDLQHFLKKRILATAAKRKSADGLAKKPVLAYWSRLRTKWESSGLHALATCAVKVVAGGAWNMERKHRCGLAPSPICDLCADNVVQDDFHISWQCPAIRAHALLDGWNDIGLEAKAHRLAGGDPTLWLRGVPQQFEDINPGSPPDDWAEFTIGTDEQQDWPPGLYYSDASGGPFSAYPEVRRIAYGAMRMNDPNGDCMYNWQQSGSLVAFVGALPWEKQTVPRGELAAVVRLLTRTRSGTGIDTRIGIDCKEVINGWEAGSRRCYSSDNTDLWILFWEQVERLQYRVELFKVAAHKKLVDVLKGIISFTDWVGNSVIDNLVGQLAIRLVPTEE